MGNSINLNTNKTYEERKLNDTVLIFTKLFVAMSL